jgi:cytosine/adenosine deaminase-related metal-dependent hydrolase
VGLGSDVSGGPDASLFSVMRIGAYAQLARRSLGGEDEGQGGAPSGGAPSGAPSGTAALDPFGWLRLATLDGARALGLGDVIGSIESGKEADLIAIDPSYLAPLAGQPVDENPADLASRLIFRAHPDMVRAAWVRGRRLAGPGARG